MPVVRAAARSTGAYAQPAVDRWHRQPVPHLGGLAIALALFGGLVAAGSLRAIWPLAATSLLMVIVGFADDLRPIGPVPKLIAQVIGAALLLWLIPPVRIFGWPVFDLMLELFWIVGITNAFNLLDNMDGLAGGVAGIAGIFFVLLLITGNGATLVPLAAGMAALVGACGGFLIYNFQPASIFMGDAGSYLLGSFIAGAALMATPGINIHLVPVASIPVLILLIPILDTTFVTLMRRIGGRSAFSGGRDHISHRLVALGIGERRAVLVLYLLAALGGAVAICLEQLDVTIATGYAAAYVALLGAVAFYLAQIENERDQVDAAQAPLPSEVTNQYRIYEVAVDGVVVGLAFYFAFLIRFPGPERMQFLPYFTRVLPLVVGIQLAALWLTGKYQQVWRGVGGAEVVVIVRGTITGVAASVITVLYLTQQAFEGYSRKVFVFDAFLAPALLIAVRLALGILDEYVRKRRATGRTALIYGSGRGGALVVHELLQNRSMDLTPIGFIDDDPRKRKLQVEGLPVYGSVDQLGEMLRKLQASALVISIRDLPRDKVDRLCTICSEHGVEVHRFRFVLEDVAARDFNSTIVRFPKT